LRQRRATRIPAAHCRDHEPDFADVRQLFIDPEECIDCDACVEVCPVDAIRCLSLNPPSWRGVRRSGCLGAWRGGL
jgi:NAD-dependent dihydropyrimidine dehydrogenase PreA subunit